MLINEIVDLESALLLLQKHISQIIGLRILRNSFLRSKLLFICRLDAIYADLTWLHHCNLRLCCKIDEAVEGKQSVQWCRKRWCRGASAPPKVLIWWKSGKIPENPGKIHGNLGKISENLRNVWAKMAPNVVWFETHGTQRLQNHMKTFLWRSSQHVCLRKRSHKKWPKSFSGNCGEIRAKILCTPKNLPAPTPMNQSIWSN